MQHYVFNTCPMILLCSWKKYARINHSSHTSALKIARFAFWSYFWSL